MHRNVQYSFITKAIKNAWFPPGLEIRENLEKWEGIFQSGKSQGILPKILEKQENLNKKNVFCESQGILHKMLENQWI